MTIKTFAAIDVGSYELAMKIYELSVKKGMREIDHIRYQIELGTDTYATGKIGYERVDELCRILREFSQIMKSYRVDAYRAYGTSAIRETDNMTIILDQIRIRTGIQVDVLSNSEQRFLDYKSIASKGEVFSRIIENGTAIVDIGGGSIQISLFDKDTLVSTQNLRLGVLRMREALSKIEPQQSQVEELVEELVSNQLYNFKRMYLKDRSIKNIIIVDDYLSVVLQNRTGVTGEKGYIDVESYQDLMNALRDKNVAEISNYLGIPEENSILLFLSAVLMRRLIKVMEAEWIFAPGVTLCDGIAYEYAEQNHIMTLSHNFEQDIIACAQNISKRYMGSKKRGETLEKITLTLFDSMKKIHGLGKRERLLLQIAALLHDCGKYISLSLVGTSSYSIIMATEIIGLSHTEREIVANIVKYNHLDFDYYEELSKYSTLDRNAYLSIAKLTAILRLANGLDKSHKQKFKDIRITVKEDDLIIMVDTQEDISLEKGLFGDSADFFEEVYSMRPIIKQKKMN
ncbi:MAG: HD domain-containing protein [Lachnospiraceae bacterium]